MVFFKSLLLLVFELLIDIYILVTFFSSLVVSLGADVADLVFLSTGGVGGPGLDSLTLAGAQDEDGDVREDEDEDELPDVT